MSRQAVFHFPDRTEIRYLDVMPDTGAIVLAAGVAWVVTGVEGKDGAPISCTLVPKESSQNGHEQARGGRPELPPSFESSASGLAAGT